MKRLILEITYTDYADLLAALNTFKQKVVSPGEIRLIRDRYAVRGYLHVENIDEYRVINGEYTIIRQSKMNDDE